MMMLFVVNFSCFSLFSKSGKMKNTLTDFIGATGGANRFVRWRRLLLLLCQLQVMERRRMASGSFNLRVAQIRMRIVFGRKRLRSRSAVGQQFALLGVTPLHPTILEPDFHLE
jgi:hypothetical protein